MNEKTLSPDIDMNELLPSTHVSMGILPEVYQFKNKVIKKRSYDCKYNVKQPNKVNYFYINH